MAGAHAAAVCGLLLAFALPAQPARPGAESSSAVASLVSSGRDQLVRGDLLAARTTFRRLRTADPDGIEGLLGLGEVHLELGHADLAESYARAARRLHPKSPRAAALLVRSLLRHRRFDDAVELSSQCVETLPQVDAELLAAHASALFRVQRTAEAAAAYLRVLDFEPMHAEAHVRLGSGLIDPDPGHRTELPGLAAAVAAAERGDLDRAIEHLSATLADHPAHPIAHRLLGEVLLQAEAEVGIAAVSDEFARLRAAVPVPRLTGPEIEKFMPAWRQLAPAHRAVAARAVALFRSRLSGLAARTGRHDILGPLERTTDAPARLSLRGKRTFDGRVWDDVRGIGGLRAATGIEALEEASQFGFDTLTHELAHQAHLYSFPRADRMRIRRLYEAARDNDRFLDYYAANNEAEYFGQGVEAFNSYGKRPGCEPTHGHTRFELYRRDRDLHDYIAQMVEHDPLEDPVARRRILPAAVHVALLCGRPDDALIAAEMMDDGLAKTALVARAKRAVLLAKSY